MAIVGPALTPENQAAYDALVAKRTATADGRTSVRTRRIVRQKKAPKPPGANLKQCQTLARDLYLFFGLKLTASAKKAWIDARAAELVAGLPGAEYWMPLGPITTEYFRSTAGNIPHPNPPPYAYRTQGLLPSQVNYPSGTADVGPPRHQGHQVGSYWHDEFIVWRRQTYERPDASGPNHAAPMFAIIEGNLSISADHRGSRPMLSLSYRANMDNLPNLQAGRFDPPLIGAKSFYWRYKVPLTQPPYFNATIARHILTALPRHSDNPDGDHVALSITPRPMRGRGNNNNTTVTTTWNGTETLYVPNVCHGVTRKPITRVGNNTWYQHDFTAGTQALLPWQPGFPKAAVSAQHWLSPTSGNQLTLRRMNGATVRNVWPPAPYLYWGGSITPAPMGWWITATTPVPNDGTHPPAMDVYLSFTGRIIETRNLVADNAYTWWPYGQAVIGNGHLMDSGGYLRWPGYNSRYWLFPPGSQTRYVSHKGRAWAVTGFGAAHRYDNPPPGPKPGASTFQLDYWLPSTPIADIERAITNVIKGNDGIYLCHADGHTLIDETGILETGTYRPLSQTETGFTTCNQ